MPDRLNIVRDEVRERASKRTYFGRLAMLGMGGAIVGDAAAVLNFFDDMARTAGIAVNSFQGQVVKGAATVFLTGVAEGVGAYVLRNQLVEIHRIASEAFSGVRSRFKRVFKTRTAGLLREADDEQIENPFIRGASNRALHGCCS